MRWHIELKANLTLNSAQLVAQLMSDTRLICTQLTHERRPLLSFTITPLPSNEDPKP